MLLWKGEVVERFPSVTAFVETHLALVATLDAEQDKLLESSYTPWLGSVSDDAHSPFLHCGCNELAIAGVKEPSVHSACAVTDRRLFVVEKPITNIKRCMKPKRMVEAGHLDAPLE